MLSKNMVKKPIFNTKKFCNENFCICICWPKPSWMSPHDKHIWNTIQAGYIHPVLGKPSSANNAVFFNIVQRGGGTVHWKQGYRGQFHILHWILLLFRFSDEIKVRIQYFKVVSIHFMSDVWLKAHFPQKSFVIWSKIRIFETKTLISRYFATFQLPNYLSLQKMNKIQLFSHGEIQAKQI